MAPLAPGGLEAAVEVGRILAGPGRMEQRAEAVLDVLCRLVPFRAGGIYLLDPERRAHVPVVVRGYSEAVREYLTSPACTEEIEVLGLTRSRSAIRLRDSAVPPERLPGWRDHLRPAGFREGLGVGLFTADGRHLGLLGLHTDTDRHPTAAARDLIGTMTPMIANAIDPLRSISRMAEMVDDAQAAIVLTRAGDPLRLPGMPSHPVLDPGTGVLTVACERLVTERSSGSFLAPYAPRGAPATYLLVTVLACAPSPPYHPIGVVLVSPPGDLYGLSRRELEVLGLVVEGWPNHRIAAAMALSQRTVNTHLERILAKLGVPTRTVAAVHALRFGLYLPRPLNGVRRDLRPG